MVSIRSEGADSPRMHTNCCSYELPRFGPATSDIGYLVTPGPPPRTAAFSLGAISVWAGSTRMNFTALDWLGERQSAIETTLTNAT